MKIPLQLLLLLLVLYPGFAFGQGLCPGFGMNGIAHTLESHTTSLNAVTEHNGKVIAVGYYIGSSKKDFLIARFNANGTPDATFGVNGIVVLDITNNDKDDEALAVKIASDGRILVGGVSDGYGTLIKLNTNGTLYTSFGSSGKIIKNTLYSTIEDILISSNGTIYALGKSFETDNIVFRHLAVHAYTSSGAALESFGENGAFHDLGFGIWHQTAVRGDLQSDGKIVIGITKADIASIDNWVLLRLTEAGEIDDSFGTDGRVSDPEFATAYIQDLQLDAEGSIFVGGFSNFDSDNPSLAIVKKFQPDGDSDNSFNMTGSAWHLLAGNGALAHALVLGDNGKVYFAGSKKNGMDKKDFLLAAFNGDGEDDGDFGVHIDRIPTTSEGELRSLIRLSDGSFIACGNSTGLDQQYGVVIKYKSNGDLDNAFNGTGYALTRHVLDGNMHRIVMQPDGKILVAGSFLNERTSGVALARFESNGQPDLTFGTYGYVHKPISDRANWITSLYVYPDGKILAGGVNNHPTSFEDYLIIKFNADGTIDEDFGTDGYVTKHVGAYGKHNRLNYITVDNEGRILIAGEANYLGGSYGDATIMRLLPNGDNDPAFGNNGVLQVSLYVTNDSFRDIAITNDGSIYALGSSASGDVKTTVAKITPEGVLDESFGTDGLSSVRYDDMDTQGIELIVQPDGKLVLGCVYRPDGSSFEDNVFLYRMLPSGVADASFGENGFAHLTIPASKDVRLEGLVMNNDGVFYAAGIYVSTAAPTGNHFYMATFNSDGTQSQTLFKTKTFLPEADIVINPATNNVYAGVIMGASGGFLVACIGSVGTDDDDDDDDDDDNNDPDCSAMPKPSITLLGDVLYASDGDAFQWYRDGEELQGETNQSLVIDPVVGGVFNVEVTVDGCQKFSPSLDYVVTGTSPEINTIINVSPNPVQDQVCIKSALDLRQVKVRILSVQGTYISEYQNLSGFDVCLPAQHLPPGMYLLMIQSSNGTEVVKIAKSN
ncbi:MAG TPA: T9SS type A sorting domain-containing protein [Ohtaekwangia sp.]|nr:T9SS type A sorting domain-containing protein [Ohtaekwangia sp.]